MMMKDKHKIPITILICDDDDDDRMLTQQALEDAHISNELRFVEDGEEMLDYLYQRGKYSGETGAAPRPGLILLDLNMPKMDGREALRLHQGRRHAARHPGRDSHDVEPGRRHHQELPARRQLVHHEAGHVLRIGGGDERARPILARNRRTSAGSGVGGLATRQCDRRLSDQAPTLAHVGDLPDS